jgi:hypothetical protein
MEEKRLTLSSPPALYSSIAAMGLIPFSFSVFSTVFFKNKRTLLRAILITAGFRLLAPFIARRVFGFFSKTKPAIS